jgi:hypothetical protein
MDQTDQRRIAEVKAALKPYLKPVITPPPVRERPEREYRMQRSAEPPYPAHQPISGGESVGLAWQAVLDRLPEGWIIDQLKYEPKKGMRTLPTGEVVQENRLWVSHARPLLSGAWGRSGLKHLKDGYRGSGISVVEALLDLAIRAETTNPDGPSNASLASHLESIDQLFRTLFPDP